jgi:RHS repeat-associated protein
MKILKRYLNIIILIVVFSILGVAPTSLASPQRFEGKGQGANRNLFSGSSKPIPLYVKYFAPKDGNLLVADLSAAGQGDRDILPDWLDIDEDEIPPKDDSDTPELEDNDEPYDAFPLFQSAEEDCKAQRWEDAMEKYEAITQISSPYASKAHLQRGKYFKYKRRWSEALREFEEAVRKAEDIRDLEDTLTSVGALNIAKGDYQTALSIFESILSKTDDWQQIKYSVYWIKELRRRIALGDEAGCETCGQSALKEIMKLKDIKVSDSEIDTLSHLTKGGASMEDLRQFAESKGLKVQGVEVSLEQLKSIDKPLIALLQDPKHYVVVTGFEPKGVRIIDPENSSNSYLMPEKEFGKAWKGHALVFSDIKPEMVTAFLSTQAMKTLKGKICSCCPTTNMGTQVPNTHFDKTPVDPLLLVNTVNLNFVVQDTDLSYSGRGPSVEITRTYNGFDPNDGPFGHSWTFNYNVTLWNLNGYVEDPNGDIDVRRETGTIHHFTRVGDGIHYNPPNGVYDTLIKHSTNPVTYSLTLKRSKLTQNFDASGKLTSITDRNGNAITFQYVQFEGDPEKYLQTITDATNNRHTTFNYIVDTLGKRRIDSIVDPSNPPRTVSYTYNDGNLTSFINMAGNTIEYTYDHWSQDNKSYSFMTSITIYKPTTPATPLTTTIGYTIPGYDFRSITDPMGNIRSYGPYSWEGRRITDANGNYTDYLFSNQYNVNGYTKEITDAAGNKVVFGYDNKCNRTSIQRYNLLSSGTVSISTATISYDATGNITEIIDPMGNTSRFTYVDDNLTQFQDPAGNTYIFEYDTKSNLTKIKYPDYPANGEATFTYNNYGEVTDFVDAKGNAYHFEYDDYGNRTASRISYHSEVDSYTYDDVGRVMSHTDPNHTDPNLPPISYGYDGIDRLTDVTYPDNFVKQYTYDLCCGLSTVTDRNGTVGFTYNDSSRLIEVKDMYDNVIGYGYDNAGNLTSLTYPGNKTVTYGYDYANRLTRVTDWLGNITTYEYGITGNYVKTIYPDGSTVVHQFDDANRLTSISDFKADGTMNAVFDYTLNSIGNRTGISSYQPLNVAPSPPAANYTYNYDNRLKTVGSTTFTHDANGNLVTKTLGSTTTTYTWNYDNMLTDILVNDVTTHQYKYDGLGNRVSKRVNTSETRYVVDPNGTLLAEMNANNIITSYYVYGLGLISKITPTEEAYYYHYDGLGSTVAITNSTGTAVNTYSYDEFGKVISQSETISNSFKYVGKFGVMDDGNGLLYMRARYYDPEIGRFINKDPIGFAGGFNMYTYAGNNPVNFIDPSGLFCVYSQSTGSLTCTHDATGQQYLSCNGYAGNGPGLKNPNAQNQKNVGPLPQGKYTVGAPNNRRGPFTRPLTQDPSNNMFDRSGFLIHGDNAAQNHSASTGCIVVPRDCRSGILTGETLRVDP